MKTSSGMTLVEMLVAMAILSVLMLAFTQVFGSSLRASAEINARNELISEGQIAQQLIASRLQSAYHIYPNGTTLKLTAGGTTTPNTIRTGAGQGWTVGTDPFVAMLVPPTMLPAPAAGATAQCPANSASPSVKDSNKQFCFTFYAYYPIRRGTLIASNPTSAPPADSTNESVWILMEYRANIYDGVDRSIDRLAFPPTTSTLYTGRTGTMLVDYVQPQTLDPTYKMFNMCLPKVSTTGCPTGTNTADPSWVNLSLHLLQNRAGKPFKAPTGTAPLSTRVYPRNTQ